MRQPAPISSSPDAFSAIAPIERRARRSEIACKRFARRMAQRHDAVLGALAGATYDLRALRERFEGQVAQFAHPQSAPIQQLQHRPVAQIARIRTGDGLHQPAHRLFRQDLRKRHAFLRRFQSFHGIGRDEPHLAEMRKELLDGRESTRARRGALRRLMQRFKIRRQIRAHHGVHRRASAARKESDERANIAEIRLLRLFRESALKRQCGGE